MDLQKLLKTQGDRCAAVACTALGALLLIVGWIGVSGTAFLAEQAPYMISGGIGGIFLLGVGATLWISADLRDEWRKLDRIEQAIGDGALRWADEGEPLVAEHRAAGKPSRQAEAEPVSLYAPAGAGSFSSNGNGSGNGVKVTRATQQVGRTKSTRGSA